MHILNDEFLKDLKSRFCFQNFHVTKCFDFHHLELIVIENDSLSHGEYHVRNPDANEYHVINYHVSDSGTSMFARPRFCFLFLDFNQIHYKLTVLNRTMRNIIQITPLLCFKLLIRVELLKNTRRSYLGYSFIPPYWKDMFNSEN